jgi:hypothetical protein
MMFERMAAVRAKPRVEAGLKFLKRSRRTAQDGYESGRIQGDVTVNRPAMPLARSSAASACRVAVVGGARQARDRSQQGMQTTRKRHLENDTWKIRGFLILSGLANIPTRGLR